MTSTQEFKSFLARPHLLMIESHGDTLQSLRDALDIDYRLTPARSGSEALALLGQKRFDLILLDISAPASNHMDMLQRVRTLAHEAPIILISTLKQEEDIVRGLQKGANDYVTRPLDAAVVRSRIKSQLALMERSGKVESEHSRDRSDMKNHFVQIASHDLKNPLNNILLTHYYLRTLVGDQPEVAQALDTIQDTVNSMTAMVEDFLDSAALENGNLKVRLEAVEVAQVIAEVVLRYSVSAGLKKIALLADEIEGLVYADYARLVQILNNLVSNAVKYTPPDRSITISVRTLGNRVRIQVADEGPGIPAEERPKLFKPFSKLSTRPTGGESSSGLGLWIVKELVMLQNGSAGVDCPASGGSIFWVDLPAYIPATAG